MLESSSSGSNTFGSGGSAARLPLLIRTPVKYGPGAVFDGTAKVSPVSVAVAPPAMVDGYTNDPSSVAVSGLICSVVDR